MTSGKKALLGAGVVAAIVGIAVMFVIPAETGWDPTGVGKATGLVEIADPVSEEQQRGQARMAAQEVLVLSQTPLAPAAGVVDAWEYELAPFESVEFKYTVGAGAPVVFRWQGSGPLHYDMHAHPFAGGEEVTESYGVGDAALMQGRYTPAFDGIHGWFWQNRSLDNVTVRLEASGGMSHSTIYAANSAEERPLAGAAAGPQGSVAGHAMQQPAPELDRR